MSYQEKLFKLREDVKIVGPYLKQVSEEIRTQKVSKYPIFIVHQEKAIRLGKMILDKENSRTYWSYNASLLEEFVQKNFVAENNLEEFKKVYKSPDEYMCFFLLTPEDMNFVFCPFDMNKEWG